MSEDVKDRIKTAAVKLFANNGYSGTSVREISQAAKVNIAAISYHFGSKDGLLRDLFKEISKTNLQTLVSTIGPAKTVDEFEVKLRLYTKHFIASSLANSDRVEMIFRNIDYLAENYAELFDESFGQMHRRLITFFSSAQDIGILRKDVDPMTIGQIFMSSLTDVVRHRASRQKLLGFSIEDPATAHTYSDSLVKCFLNGVKNGET